MRLILYILNIITIPLLIHHFPLRIMNLLYMRRQFHQKRLRKYIQPLPILLILLIKPRRQNLLLHPRNIPKKMLPISPIDQFHPNSRRQGLNDLIFHILFPISLLNMKFKKGPYLKLHILFNALISHKSSNSGIIPFKSFISFSHFFKNLVNIVNNNTKNNAR